MAKFRALMLWTDAWIADTKHLSRCERGTYHDLLVLMWRSPGCTVPNDDKWLAKHLGMTIVEVESELRPLIAEFCQTDGNRIWQKRLKKEFGHSMSQSARAKSRWRKKKDECPKVRAADATVTVPVTVTEEDIDSARVVPLISPQAKALAEECRRATGIDPIELPGLDYQAQVWTERKYPPPLVVATFVRIAQARPLKPLSYFTKAINSASMRQDDEHQSRSGNGGSSWQPPRGSREDTRRRTVAVIDQLDRLIAESAADEPGGSAQICPPALGRLPAS